MNFDKDFLNEALAEEQQRMLVLTERIERAVLKCDPKKETIERLQKLHVDIFTLLDAFRSEELGLNKP